MPPERVMFLAGEASGDLHGSGVIRELLHLRPGLDVFGMGGDRMRDAGMDVIVDIHAMAFMGFVEVVRNLKTVFRVERELGDLLHSRRPDAVVLIDYPGFNLRFARTVKRAGIPVLYYISPQVWAWHRSRVKEIRKVVAKMHVIFPFEVEIYEAAGVPVEFVGHPLVEHVGPPVSRREWLQENGFDPGRPVLGLFPGSRLQEIERILPTMLDAGRQIAGAAGAQIAVSVAPNLDRAAIADHLTAGHPVRLVEHATHALMQCADAAIVTSGTATLETGWFGTPFVVVYKTSALTYAIGRLLVDVQHIGLVNIVAGRRVVPELVQHQCTPARIVAALTPLLTDPRAAAHMRSDLSVIRERLGGPGASRRVAESILSFRGAA